MWLSHIIEINKCVCLFAMGKLNGFFSNYIYGCIPINNNRDVEVWNQSHDIADIYRIIQIHSLWLIVAIWPYIFWSMLVSNGNTQLPKPMLTHLRRGPGTFWGLFHKRWISHQSLWLAWKWLENDLKIASDLPGPMSELRAVILIPVWSKKTPKIIYEVCLNFWSILRIPMAWHRSGADLPAWRCRRYINIYIG